METGDTGYASVDIEKEAEAKGDDGAKEKGFWCCGLDCARRKELAAARVGRA